MRALLISTYELGRQPFGLASPAAWLRNAGHAVQCADLSRETLDEAAVRDAGLVGFYLPMHTATRLALPIVRRVAALNRGAHLCAFGLYAPLNAAHLHQCGVTSVLSGEFEADLVDLAARLSGAAAGAPSRNLQNPSGGAIPRLAFVRPDRSGLPPLAQYARLSLPGGERRDVAYTESSRGCKHLCRHCPVVPIYGGQFRIVPVDVVLADIRQQVAQGARHVTFGDPDFFNGIGHARAVVGALAREFPGLTYDVTIKIEHLVTHARDLPRLRDTGCLFVTSAAESVDDRILERFQKGHTRADFERAVACCRDIGLALVPTFVAFTPWTSLEGYGNLLDAIEALELVDSVPSIQLALRLLIPSGSRLLDLDDVRALVQPFEEATLVHPWVHQDPRVDALQRDVEAAVARLSRATRRMAFDHVRDLVWRAAGAAGPRPLAAGVVRARTEVPYLDEPWYC